MTKCCVPVLHVDQRTLDGTSMIEGLAWVVTPKSNQFDGNFVNRQLQTKHFRAQQFVRVSLQMAVALSATVGVDDDDMMMMMITSTG